MVFNEGIDEKIEFVARHFYEVETQDAFFLDLISRKYPSFKQLRVIGALSCLWRTGSACTITGRVQRHLNNT
jgi:hypothetical protein